MNQRRTENALIKKRIIIDLLIMRKKQKIKFNEFKFMYLNYPKVTGSKIWIRQDNFINI